MSGPKVVRIVTLEEVLEICRGRLAQLAKLEREVALSPHFLPSLAASTT